MSAEAGSDDGSSTELDDGSSTNEDGRVADEDSAFLTMVPLPGIL